MKIFVIKKLKGRKYKSEEILRALFDLNLTHDGEGAPVVDNSYISISDTTNYWACVLCSNPIGLDMEEGQRYIKDNVAKRLHIKEQEYLAPLNSAGSEWKEEFLSIWVRKEAYMKLMGKGLKFGLSNFRVVSDDPFTQVSTEYFVNSFSEKNIYFGLAGKLEDIKNPEIEFAEYDAPFVQSCIDAAASILDSRMHSAEELKKKLLEKGYAEDEINRVCESFSSSGYINDEAYAKNLAEKYAKAGKSPRLIALELEKRGISRPQARAASDEYKEGSRDAALALARKTLKGIDLKQVSSEEREKLLAKVGRKLASCGYETSIIYDILDKLKL